MRLIPRPLASPDSTPVTQGEGEQKNPQRPERHKKSDRHCTGRFYVLNRARASQ